MKKGIGDKVLRWFIVDAEAEAEAHAEADAAGSLPVRASTPAAVVAPGGAHDARAFAAVYRAAGVDDGERERLSKVLALVESLPSETSLDVKRSIVAASLEAFGVSIDRILVTGEGALAALDGYVVGGQDRTKEILASAEARIAKLTSEIEEVRRLMDIQVAAQKELARATTSEQARVRVVLDFFDAGTSARAASPPSRLVRLK
jgi:hypothetical protein